MAKRKPQDKFYNMGEIEATRKYAQTLKQVYQEKGAMVAAGYEIKSAFYSLGKRLGNLMHNLADFVSVEANPSGPTRLSRRQAQEMYENSADKRRRKAERKEYILRAHKHNSLETTAATTAIIGIIGGIFFLSSNITGNVIGLNQTSSNWIGGVLFLIGLVGAFAYFKKR